MQKLKGHLTHYLCCFWYSLCCRNYFDEKFK